jgi:phospholipid/cholesterol/gamma-HCH transport system permease protein
MTRGWRGLRGQFEQIGAVALLGGRAAVRAFSRPFGFREIGRQVEAIGYRSLSIVVLTAVFSSMVMTVQFAVQLARFGAKEYVGNVVALSLVRELGPVLTALMVGGRVGAGIAAELGSMKVTEQIDAMRAMGADPVKELVSPRLVASAVALPLLTMLANVLGVLGAMLIARLDAGISMTFFINTSLKAVEMTDLAGGLIKSVIFGVTIALVACRVGLSARGGTAGVGEATTRTVVITSVSVLVLDFILTRTLVEVGL